MKTYATRSDAELNRTFVFGGLAFESPHDLTVGSVRLEHTSVVNISGQPAVKLTFQDKQGKFFTLRFSTVATHEILAALDAPKVDA